MSHLKKLIQISIGIGFYVLLTGAFVNVYEKKEESEGALLAAVSSIQENYIALVFNKDIKGVEEEIGFARGPDIKLINKHHWSEIKKGELVLAKYTEIRQVREGRVDTGEFKRESIVLNRRLSSLRFTKNEKTQLLSGV